MATPEATLEPEHFLVERPLGLHIARVGAVRPEAEVAAPDPRVLARALAERGIEAHAVLVLEVRVRRDRREEVEAVVGRDRERVRDLVFFDRVTVREDVLLAARLAVDLAL